MTVVLPRAARALAGALLTAAAVHASAADPQRGAMLFATPPASGLLACADCHGADPQVNNFGNIWAGRNAVALIQRAVQANTGGMGYFGGFYGSADFADIAAYLGNAPAALVFDPTELGRDSAPQSVSITTSTKIGVGALQLRTEGDFVVIGGSCGTELPRFANCAVDLSFRPSAAGQRSGSLLITHDGTPTPVRIALAGLATARPAAIARLEPAQLAFVAAGPAGVQSANVLNDSAERLTLGSITASTAAFRVVGGSCRPGALLLPGRRCQVALRFDPSGVGAAAGTLTVRHDGVGGLSTLALSARADKAVPAGLHAETPVVDFGSVAAGTRAAVQTVTWRNTGSVDWRWQSTNVNAPGVSVLADACRSVARLAPGQACAVVLAFEPQRAGGSSGRLLLQGAGDVPAATVPVTGATAAVGIGSGAAADGTTAQPGLQVDAAALDFGEAAVGLGAAGPRRVTLLNAGTAAWRASAIVTTGADAAAFRLAGSCAVGKTIEAGDRCTVDISFVPATPGAHQATLLLQGEDGGEPAQVSLAGRAVAAGLPRLEADTAWLEFAPLRPGNVATLKVSVGNAGSAPAGPLRLQVDGPFRIDQISAGCLATLPPGGHCTVGVLFAPTAPGAARGRLRFGGAGSVALRGEAVDAAMPQLLWQAPLAAPSHGAAAVGGAPLESAFLTLVNRGDAASGPLALTLSGRHASDFGLDAAGSCRAGVVLAPRQACSLRVAFRPAAVGPRSASLRVQGGAAFVDLPFVDLPLEGRGRAGAQGLLQALPRALWFEAPAAAGVPAGLVWRNDGPAAVSVTSIGLRGDGFAQRAGGCPVPPFILQPGQSCGSEVAWNGSADARFGAELVARVDATTVLSLPLAVVEDPARRSNVGGSGGGGFGAAWALALALAALALGRAESGHA